MGNATACRYTPQRLLQMMGLKAACLTMAFCIVGCAGVQRERPTANTLAECLNGQYCKARGPFKVTSDGHAYIGVLELSDGCLNVSIPDGTAKELFQKEASLRTVDGRIFNYFSGDTLFEQRVNGRRIGQGLCGSKFLFVK